jgi:DNA-binding transcriptional LysR family regulator
VAEPLVLERAGLAVSDDHPLAAQRSVGLATLGSETFALVDARDGPGYNATVLELCRRAGLEPRTRGSGDGPMAWETAVRTGGCVGLTTRSTARSSALGIRLLELRPRSYFQIELVRPCVDEESQRPAVRALVTEARRLAADGLLSSS